MENFPQYRKLTNDRNYYRIESPSSMIEIQVVGKYWIQHELNARILPERLLIQDLLAGTFPGSETITEVEFQHFMLACTSQLTQRIL